MTSTEQSRSVPQLRFPEFTDNWVITNLGNISEIYDGTHQTPKYVNSGVPFVSVENIRNIENSDKYITKEAFGKFKIKPQKDDILMTRITAGIIGDTTIVKNNNPLGYYVSLALIRKKDNTINVNYLEQRINSVLFKKELHKRIIHIAFPKKINLGEIGYCKIGFPSITEQTKIANFLIAVDKRINLLQKKKAELELYKKGVMQKLFSQQIRFKKEEGSDFPDWEEKKLGEVCEVTTGKLDANAMVENGEYRFYTCAKDFYKINNYAFNFEALLISGNGANVGYVHHYKGKFNAYQRTYVLYNLNAHYEYLKYFLDKNLRRRIHREKKDSNTPYIVMETLTDMSINLPDISEQQKIANFLLSIDKSIEKLGNQIDDSVVFQQGLLQKMFV